MTLPRPSATMLQMWRGAKNSTPLCCIQAVAKSEGDPTDLVQRRGPGYIYICSLQFVQQSIDYILVTHGTRVKYLIRTTDSL